VQYDGNHDNRMTQQYFLWLVHQS